MERYIVHVPVSVTTLFRKPLNKFSFDSQQCLKDSLNWTTMKVQILSPQALIDLCKSSYIIRWASEASNILILPDSEKNSVSKLVSECVDKCVCESW